MNPILTTTNLLPKNGQRRSNILYLNPDHHNGSPVLSVTAELWTLTWPTNKDMQSFLYERTWSKRTGFFVARLTELDTLSVIAGPVKGNDEAKLRSALRAQLSVMTGDKVRTSAVDLMKVAS
jgi:hypothetical protein